MSFEKISFAEFDNLKQKEDTILIDVREGYEFEDFNIGGINIPMGDIPNRVNELNNYSTLLLCCKSGKRSNAIGYYLNENIQGKNIYSLDGGLESIQA